MFARVSASGFLQQLQRQVKQPKHSQAVVVSTVSLFCSKWVDSDDEGDDKLEPSGMGEMGDFSDFANMMKMGGEPCSTADTLSGCMCRRHCVTCSNLLDFLSYTPGMSQLAKLPMKHMCLHLCCGFRWPFGVQ